MNNWIEQFQNSINYIEDHLTDKLDAEAIAETAALSSFYYQRIFTALCGMTLMEYIRARRMTQAALELTHADERVIDVALKYGYDSPDSFTRAFQKFHGITPAKARESGAPLRSFAPLHVKVILEGGKMLDYRIVEKAPFTIVGFKRTFNTDTSYQEIPKFWNEWKAGNSTIKGMFALCMDQDGKKLDYWIADNYVPWMEVPQGCKTIQIPGSLWAEFRCKGPLPDSLQSVNTEIWSKWLPTLKGYKLAGNYNLEVYAEPAINPEDTVSYIWIPLTKS